jgi:hypothetical protein
MLLVSMEDRHHERLLSLFNCHLDVTGEYIGVLLAFKPETDDISGI